MANKDFHVIISFGAGFPASTQGEIMLDLEKDLRQRRGLPAEVYKETVGDDSRLRRGMTPEQRDKL